MEASGDKRRKSRYACYAHAWRRRWAEEREAGEQRRALALEEAGRAARLLVERYGVRRVVLFGSLAWGRFQATSDIDLAVEGLAPERFYRAGAELDREISVPVDLKLVAECPPLLRQRFEMEGIVLHEG